MAIGYNIPTPRQMTPEEIELERQRLLARDPSLGLPGTPDVYTYGIPNPTGVGRSNPTVGLQTSPARGEGGGLIPRNTRLFMEDLPPGFERGNAPFSERPGRPMLPISAAPTYQQNLQQSFRRGPQDATAPKKKDNIFEAIGKEALDKVVRTLPAVGGFIFGGPAGAAAGGAVGTAAAEAIEEGGKLTKEGMAKAAVAGGKSLATGAAGTKGVIEGGAKTLETLGAESAEDVKKLLGGAETVEAALLDDAPEAAKAVSSNVAQEYGEDSSSVFRQKQIDRARKVLIEAPDTLNVEERERMEQMLPGGQRLQLQAFDRARVLSQAPGITRRLIDRGGLDSETKRNLAAIGRAAVSEYELFRSGNPLDAAERAGASNLDAGYAKGLASPLTGQLDYQDEEMLEYYKDLADLDPREPQNRKRSKQTPTQVASESRPARLNIPLVDEPNSSNTITPAQYASQQLVQRILSPVDELLSGGDDPVLSDAELAAIRSTPGRQLSLSNAGVDSFTPTSVGVPRPSVPDAVMADRGSSPAMVSLPEIPIQIQTGMNVPNPQVGMQNFTPAPSRRGTDALLDGAARNTIVMNPQMQAQTQAVGPPYTEMYQQQLEASNQGGGFSAFNQPVGNVAPLQSIPSPGIGRIDAPAGGMAPFRGVATQPSPDLLYTDENGNLRDRRTGEIVRRF